MNILGWVVWVVELCWMWLWFGNGGRPPIQLLSRSIVGRVKIEAKEAVCVV